MSFKDHINISNAANHKLDDNLFMKLFKGIVRPSSEYNSTVWSPHLKGLNDKIQRRATSLQYEEQHS